MSNYIYTPISKIRFAIEETQETQLVKVTRQKPVKKELENKAFKKEYDILSWILDDMNEVCDFDYLLLVVDEENRMFNFKYTFGTTNLYNYFEESYRELSEMNMSAELQEKRRGVDDTELNDLLSNWEKSSDRMEQYRDRLKAVDYMIDNSTTIRCYFLVVVNDENSHVIMSPFIKKFYFDNKKKIEESLKIYFK